MCGLLTTGAAGQRLQLVLRTASDGVVFSTMNRDLLADPADREGLTVA